LRNSRAYCLSGIAHLAHRFGKLLLADIPGLTFLAHVNALTISAATFRNVIGILSPRVPKMRTRGHGWRFRLA
jgi:hypothetical protein